MITIRPACSADFLAIAALDRKAWQQNAHHEFIPDGEHVWRIWCEHALLQVACLENGSLVGAVVAFPTVDRQYCLHKAMVDPNCRGEGVGSKLFDAMIEQLDQRKADCFLTVDPTNEAALALYRKKGFTESRLVKGYYRSHEDRYVLTRRTQK